MEIEYTKARAIGSAKGEDHIPLAPSFTTIGSISAKMKNGFTGSLRYRFMDQWPANKFNTVKAQGYFITDMLLVYVWKKFEPLFQRKMFLTANGERRNLTPNGGSNLNLSPLPRYITHLELHDF